MSEQQIMDQDILNEKELLLPDSDTISEWFSQDHLDRLKRIQGSNNGIYSAYYVKSKGAL